MLKNAWMWIVLVLGVMLFGVSLYLWRRAEAVRHRWAEQTAASADRSTIFWRDGDRIKRYRDGDVVTVDAEECDGRVDVLLGSAHDDQLLVYGTHPGHSSDMGFGGSVPNAHCLIDFGSRSAVDAGYPGSDASSMLFEHGRILSWTDVGTAALVDTSERSLVTVEAAPDPRKCNAVILAHEIVLVCLHGGHGAQTMQAHRFTLTGESLGSRSMPVIHTGEARIDIAAQGGHAALWSPGRLVAVIDLATMREVWRKEIAQLAVVELDPRGTGEALLAQSRGTVSVILHIAADGSELAREELDTETRAVYWETADRFWVDAGYFIARHDL